MILTLTVVCSVLVLSNIFLLFGIRRLINKEKRAIIEVFESPEFQMQVAKFVDTMAGTFGTRIAASLKATFMGVQSVESKIQARVEGAITKDLITQNSPVAGIILDKFPAVAKLVHKNPGLLDIVTQYLGKGKQPEGGDNGDTSMIVDQY